MRERVIDADMVMTAQGQLEEAFNRYLADIADERDEHKIEERKEKFRREIMSNPAISKGNLVFFINEHAVVWSMDARTARDGFIPMD